MRASFARPRALAFVAALIAFTATACGTPAATPASGEPSLSSPSPVASATLSGAPGQKDKAGKQSNPGQKDKAGKKGKPGSNKHDKAGTAADTAVAVLAALPVKGRAPMTGYSRDMFGAAWSDVDGNGCDTRNDILTRDLVERQMASDGCTVLSGALYPDPYTAMRIVFVRGKSLVDIDHVVALGNAWVTGAAQWSGDKRLALANDPLNLLAVQASANRQKGDGDAATWLPSNTAYRCDYVARQIAVKAKYGLWVTSPEKQAMTGVLAGCPDQKLPDGQFAVPVPTGSGGAGSGGAGSGGAGSGGAGSGQATRYATCTEAKAAGVTPILKAKNPQLYAANTHLDRDKDGVACET